MSVSVSESVAFPLLTGTSVSSAVSDISSPSLLFLNGEKGVWYDPSDFSTLFQDSAGTTPVTAVGQPVGLILDKSKGLVRGSELCSDPRFDNAGAWTFSGSSPGWSVSGGKAEVTATAAGNRWVNNGARLAVGKVYEITANVTVTAGGCAPDVSAAPAGDATTSGAKRWVVLASTSSLQFIGRSNFIGSIDDVSFRELPGNHATQSTATSRPILGQDATGRYYLTFDGVDDWLTTAAIDFTATDKMTVVAGVRKLSDALDQQTITELGPNSGTTAGSFAIQCSPAFTAKYRLQLFGSSRGVRDTPATYAAPNTSVISGQMDIAGSDVSNEILGRFNGVAPALEDVLSPSGTGNFGNYPLYIGLRGGTALPFNGRLYGLIVRGAQSSGGEIVNVEEYMTMLTGAN